MRTLKKSLLFETVEWPSVEDARSNVAPTPAALLDYDLAERLPDNSTAVYMRVTDYTLTSFGINFGDLIIGDTSVMPYDDCIIFYIAIEGICFRRIRIMNGYILSYDSDPYLRPKRISMLEDLDCTGVVKYIVKKI